MPVLLEDKHEASDAWKPIDNSQEPKDESIKVGDGAPPVSLSGQRKYICVRTGAVQSASSGRA